MLNAGDYSREMKDGMSVMKRGTSYFLAMVPATILLGVIGAMASTATGVANPINALDVYKRQPVAGVFPSYIASNAGPSFTGRLRWPERVWIPTHLDGGTAIPIKDSIKQKNKEIWRKFTWLVLQV